MNRGILIEMAVYTENDVYSMKPVANISSEETAQIEGQEFKMFVWNYISSQSINSKYTIDIQSIGTIYSHHCVGKRLKKASILALPQVLNADLVIAPWRKGHNKKEKTGMVSAPILIDGVKYLMNITLTRNSKNIIKPYAITLKNNNGEITNEGKVINNISVHDSNNGNSTFGNDRLSTITTSQDVNTPLPSNAKIEHFNEISKKLHENNYFKINIPNKMTNRINKVRLTESQLHNMIKESVKKILKEDEQSVYNTPEYKLLLKAFPEAGFTDEELNLLKQLYNKSNSGQNDMGEAILATLDALNFHTEAEELRNE